MEGIPFAWRYKSGAWRCDSTISTDRVYGDLALDDLHKFTEARRRVYSGHQVSACVKWRPTSWSARMGARRMQSTRHDFQLFQPITGPYRHGSMERDRFRGRSHPSAVRCAAKLAVLVGACASWIHMEMAIFRGKWRCRVLGRSVRQCLIGADGRMSNIAMRSSSWRRLIGRGVRRCIIWVHDRLLGAIDITRSIQ